MNRRDFLKLLPLISTPSIFRWPLVWAEGQTRATDPILVVLFQRGAADGLSMVPPFGDSHYNPKIRPNILLKKTGEDPAIDLDGFFGLHPALTPLHRYWQDHRLAIVHQVGSPVKTRSHFAAQDLMESGTPEIRSIDDGFLGRALMALPGSNPLRAVALQSNLPRILWGQGKAFALNSIREFSQGPIVATGTEIGFESMYEAAVDQALRGTGKTTFDAMKILRAIPTSTAHPLPYPKGPLGQHFQDIARLIKAQVGLRMAVTEVGGWDTHQNQGAGRGQLANQLRPMAETLAAFAEDLGPKIMERVCIVTLTEFGRTVRENGNNGTDHGYASAMLMLGGKIKGGKVFANWKDLAEANLFEGRDLPITTDFRDVWTAILTQHMRIPNSPTLFPGFNTKSSLKLFS